MFENLRVAVRLRNPWEAADLGFVLLRTHWRPVLMAWLSALIPVVLAVHLIFPKWLWLPPLVLWWLKPALDRIVLHILAKATFGEVPTVRSTFHNLPKILRRGLVASLLWRRFSPQRSLLLPVWQLEEQSGDDYRKRGSVLLRRGQAQAVLLTILFFLLQIVLGFTILCAVDFFAPLNDGANVLNAAFGSGDDRRHAVDVFLSVLPTLSTAILEPFYVASGFTLYLNRRVELEGWDLELTFRRMAERISQGLAKGALSLMILLLASMPAWTQPQSPARPSPREALAEVLKAPEFQVTKKEKGLRWKGDSKTKEQKPLQWPKWLKGFFRWFGFSIKWVLIICAVLAIVYVLWRSRRQIQQALRVQTDPSIPRTLFGLDIRPEALPMDLETQARRLWDQGRFREALSLLYRGALAHLVHQAGVSISESATEGECLRKAKDVLSENAIVYFKNLTEAWQRTAYAGRSPEAGDDRLCLMWGEHFAVMKVRP